MKVVLVGHHHRAAEKLLLRRNTENERYNKCIVLQGDYVEKLYVKLLTGTSIKAVKCILPLLFDSPSYKYFKYTLLHDFVFL